MVGMLKNSVSVGPGCCECHYALSDLGGGEAVVNGGGRVQAEFAVVMLVVAAVAELVNDDPGLVYRVESVGEEPGGTSAP